MKLNRDELKALIILLNLESKYKSLNIEKDEFNRLLLGENIQLENRLKLNFSYSIKFIDNKTYKQISNKRLKEERYYDDNEKFFILECEHFSPYYINIVRLSEPVIRTILKRLQYNDEDIYNKIELSFKDFLDNNSKE